MRLNKRQKQELQNKEFCKHYLKADWDGCAANEYFSVKCDPNPSDKYYGKLRDEFFDSLREIYIAKNQVYRSVARLAFEKKSIVQFLTEVSRDTIQISDKINDKEKFIEVYLGTCKDILEKINKQHYDFQKPEVI